MSTDEGNWKTIGAAIAAGVLLAIQGMNWQQTNALQRNTVPRDAIDQQTARVQNLENNTMSRETIEAHLRTVEHRLDIIENMVLRHHEDDDRHTSPKEPEQ